MKKRMIICALCLFVLAVGFVLYENCDTFTGNRVKNPDGYVLQFEKMNQKDSHVLELSAGDTIAVAFAVERGRVDLSIGADGEAPLYKGNDISSGNFRLPIQKDGAYRVWVSAKHAAGWIEIGTEQKKSE